MDAERGEHHPEGATEREQQRVHRRRQHERVDGAGHHDCDDGVSPPQLCYHGAAGVCSEQVHLPPMHVALHRRLVVQHRSDPPWMAVWQVHRVAAEAEVDRTELRNTEARAMSVALVTQMRVANSRE